MRTWWSPEFVDEYQAWAKQLANLCRPSNWLKLQRWRRGVGPETFAEQRYFEERVRITQEQFDEINAALAKREQELTGWVPKQVGAVPRQAGKATLGEAYTEARHKEAKSYAELWDFIKDHPLPRVHL